MPSSHQGEVMENKYTAKDLHIAFVAGQIFQGPQPIPKKEMWKNVVSEARSFVEVGDRPGSRGMMKTVDFETEFNAAMETVEREHSDSARG
jgi:hypothetical protein